MIKDITLPPNEKWHVVLVIILVVVILYYALGRYQGPPSTNRTVVNPLTGTIGASNVGAGSRSEIPFSTY